MHLTYLTFNYTFIIYHSDLINRLLLEEFEKFRTFLTSKSAEIGQFSGEIGQFSE